MPYDNNNIHQWHFRHDALEALNSFSAARNLFFCITIICLLVVQGVFISVDRGVIDTALDIPVCSDQTMTNKPCQEIKPGKINEIKYLNIGNSSFSFCNIVEEFASTPEVTADSTPKEPVKIEETPAPEIQPAPKPVIQTEIEVINNNEPANAQLVKKTLRNIVQAANVVIVFAIIMYCVCLFISIQLSLAGSLGGLANSTRAFFSALLAVLLLLPWAKTFYPGAPSMLFGFNELVSAYITKNNNPDDNYLTVIYYTRHCVLWLIVLLLIGISQWRSFSATKQIATRLLEWKTVNPYAPGAKIAPKSGGSGCSANLPHEKNEEEGPIPLE